MIIAIILVTTLIVSSITATGIYELMFTYRISMVIPSSGGRGLGP